MDERLVQHFDWTKGMPNRTNLCVYAILLARTDRQEPTSTDSDQELNLYLGNILGAAFQPVSKKEILAGDYLQLINQLLEPGRPYQRWHLGKIVGDNLLFYSSQKSHLGRSEMFSLSASAMVGLGRLAYEIAAANTRSAQEKVLHQVFACLARDWQKIEPLLSTAGDILGFDDRLPQLVASGRLVATFEDVLTAIAEYAKRPTFEHWKRLEEVVRQREWTDAGFHYELPPCPEA